MNSSDRPAVCGALDPLKSPASLGKMIHRRCRLAAGHAGPCASYDRLGVLVHAWQWLDQPGPDYEMARRNVPEGRLF